MKKFYAEDINKIRAKDKTWEEKFDMWEKVRECDYCPDKDTEECDGYLCFEWYMYNELVQRENGDTLVSKHKTKIQKAIDTIKNNIIESEVQND